MLQILPGAEFKEMPRNQTRSFCCGAGGARMWMEETIGDRINFKRTEQALETKTEVIASSCPFCMTMITDGVKGKEMTSKVQVKDLAELLNESTV